MNRGKNYYETEILDNKRSYGINKRILGIKYTFEQTGIILKNFGMRCSKPYVFDYKRPKDVEKI